jgi:hypothetical protein
VRRSEYRDLAHVLAEVGETPLSSDPQRPVAAAALRRMTTPPLAGISTSPRPLQLLQSTSAMTI